MSQRIPAETFPPGEFIQDELEARGWNQMDLAEIMGRPQKAISDLLLGKVAITAETARQLSGAFGSSAEYWMNLEAAHQLGQLRVNETDAIARRADIYKIVPVREMQKRGWIEQTKNASDLEREILHFFNQKSIRDCAEPIQHAAKQSHGASVPALAAWLRRAQQIAENTPVTGDFSAESLSHCLNTIKHLLPHKEEIRRVPRILSDHGIRFLVVEHLQHTKIDGACFWLNNSRPVVVMSLRYDRIDNFWFVLAHELAHVRNRDGQTKFTVNDIDVTLVGEGATNDDELPEREQKANAFAIEFLVPQSKLSGFIARMNRLYYRNRIELFAKSISVHPGIVVGQLQRRKEIDYKHHRQLLDAVRDLVISNALTDGWGHAPLTV
jgi:HTH-type transcriptional regulator/antitoxin HigA